MANDVNFSLKLKTEGLKEAVELSSQFNKNMQAGADAPGGTQGSRKLAAKAAPPAAFKMSPDELNSYNMSRGMGSGTTGSATSDFAAQARGLGGLVHLYATFAANLFAAEAAFRALSNAMDTSNLIRGLDQLGAATGKSLGGLAKQMVEVTNGAISMRQAMSSTAMASAGGMSNDMILRMTEVAKKASLALGRDLSDSMDRLTKGIVKVQPELLDELGIMTRVIPAQQAYAQSIGKTVSALTEYEKRQAFTNAVISEGERKFSEIQLDTNPYSKLLASMSNLAQTGLGLINNVLGPITKILAESPTGLATVMGGIGLMLLNRAIPALGAWREGLKKSAEEAEANAKRISDSFMHYDIESRLAASMRKAAPYKEAANQAIAEAQTALGSVLSAKSGIMTKLMSGSFDSEALQKQLDKELKSSTTSLETYKKQRAEYRGGDAEHLAALDKMVAKYQTRVDKIKEGNAFLSVAITNIKAETQELENFETKSNKFSFGVWAREQAVKAATSTAASKAILSQVGQNTQTMGMSAAFGKLKEDIAEANSKLTVFGKATTYVAGTMGILGSAIGTVASAIMSFAGWIGLIVSAYTILDTLLTKASTEQENYNKTVESSAESLKTAANAVTYLAEKSKSLYSQEGINNMANAISGVTNTLKEQVAAYEQLEVKSQWWDNLKDSVAGFFGKSNLDKLTKTLAADIPAALNTLILSSKSLASSSKISEILGSDVALTAQGIENALNKLSAPEKLEKIKALSTALSEISNEERKSAEAVSDFNSSLVEIGKEVDTVVNKLQFKDGPGKLGVELQASALKLHQALQDPIKGLTALRELASNAKGLSILPQDSVNELIANKTAMDELVKSQEYLQKKLQKNKDEVEKAKKSGTYAYSDVTDQTAQITAQIRNVQAAITKTTMDNANIVITMYKEGAKLIQDGLKNALAAASIVRSRADLSVASAAGVGVSSEETRLKLAELDIQKRNIEVAYKLQENLLRNTEAIDESNQLAIQRNAMDTTMLNTALLQSGKNREGKALTDQDKLDITKQQETLKTAFASATKSLLEISAARSLRAGKGTAETGEVLAGAVTRNQAFDLNKVQRQAATASVDAQKYATVAEGRLKLEDDLTKYLQKQNSLRAEGTKVSSAEITNLQALVGGYSQVIENKKESLAYDKASSDYVAKILPLINIRKKLDMVTVPKDITGDTAIEEFLTKLSKEKLDNQEALNLASEEFSKILKGISDGSAIGKTAQAQKVATENLAKSNTYLDIAIKQENAYLALQEQELSNALAVNQLDGITYANKKAEIDIEKQSLTYAKEKLNTNAAVMEAQIAYNELSLKASRSDTPAAFAEQLASAQSRLDLAKANNAAVDSSNASALTSIELTRAHNIELEKQKQHLADIAGIGTSLTAVFGEIGTALGSAIAAMDTFGKNSADNAKQILEAEKAKRIAAEQTSLAQASGVGNEDLLKFKEKEKATNENLAKLKSKATKQEMVDTANVIGSVKNLFDVKSKTYKGLASIEKAYHVAKLALDMKEFAVKLGLLEAGTVAQAGAEAANTATAEAGFMARATTYVKEIYGKTIGQLGPILGPTVAAALIASFLGSVTSSESVQNYSDFTGSQNTGTGTVFGDATKPDESLKNALELLSSTAKPELEYSSKMVALLANIDNNLSGASNSLIAGGFDASGASFRGVSSATANIGSSIPLIGGIIGGILGGGSSRSEAFAGTGLKFGDQTIGQASQMVDVRQYIDKQIHESGSGFLGFGGYDRTYYQRDYASVDSDAKEAISRAIANMKALTIEASKFMHATSDVSDAIDQLTTGLGEVALTGTSEEIKTKLTAVMSNLGSKMAKLAVVGLEPFMKTGEGYLETLVRVSTGIERATYYTDKLGIATVDYINIIKKQGDVAAEVVRQSIVDVESTISSTVSKFDFGGFLGLGVTEVTTTTKIKNNIANIIENFQGTAEEIADLYSSLVDVRTAFEALGISSDSVSVSLLKGAGGIDALVSSLDAFESGFLTSAEQTAIKQAKMDKEFKKLGLTTPKTAKEFKDLVLSLKDGGDATAELLGRVLSLSSGMKDLTGGIADVMSATALHNAQLDQTIKIYELLGNSAAVLALQRQKELDAMDEQLKPTQRYIYALQDEATARGKVTTAINNTTTSLKSSIKTLKDYKSSLNMGSLSTLDPTQKYQAAQAALKDLQATITSTATTEADRAAQADAVSKLPAASDAFLNASRMLFGGSAQYVQDVQSINDFLDMNTVKLNSQLDIASQQLSTLNEVSAALGFIQVSTADTALLLAQYLAAADAARSAATSATMTPVPAHAAGGVAYGVSLVGEKGPELVDFATPARVYSNGDTRGLLNNEQMVRELQALREEVSKLRADQREQTGQIIVTNYEANLKAADRVVNATEDAASTAKWNARSAPKIL